MTPQIDLHGVRYANVERKIDQLIFHHDPPFRIVTGNSLMMQREVLKVLNDYRGLEVICEEASVLVIESKNHEKLHHKRATHLQGEMAQLL